MPDANGRIPSVFIKRVPWHEIPVTEQEDQQFAERLTERYEEIHKEGENDE